MADDDLEAQRRAQEEQTRRENEGRQSGKGGGGQLQFSNEPDPRSPEQQLADIEDHESRKREASDEALEEQLSSYDPERIGHRLYGGMDILDTRNSQPRFAPPPVRDSNLALKQQIAAENREFRPGLREEGQAFRRNPDPTARAEVIARR